MNKEQLRHKVASGEGRLYHSKDYAPLGSTTGREGWFVDLDEPDPVGGQNCVEITQATCEELSRQTGAPIYSS